MACNLTAITARTRDGRCQRASRSGVKGPTRAASGSFFFSSLRALSLPLPTLSASAHYLLPTACPPSACLRAYDLPEASCSAFIYLYRAAVEVSTSQEAPGLCHMAPWPALQSPPSTPQLRNGPQKGSMTYWLLHLRMKPNSVPKSLVSLCNPYPDYPPCSIQYRGRTYCSIRYLARGRCSKSNQAGGR